ncbi:MAG TPA: hypothetical protein VNL70_05405, partial [Tepidisphaeraceae bacterium]|nr:hypothetical protein [Tepidisphaeraceae bacterium]
YILALSVPEPTTAPAAGEPAATTAARPAPLRPPIRLAVVQVGEVAAPQEFVRPLRQKPELFDRLDVLPAASAWPGGYGPYPSRHPGQSPQDDAQAQFRAYIHMLCQTAQSLGDDYLFIFGGNIDQATVSNGLSVLNLTIVGGYVVPSRQVRAEAKATGALVDLKTRRVVQLLTAQAEDARLAAAFTEDAARLKGAQHLRDRLADDLARQLIERLSAAEHSASSR